ncbi:hypothetical protein JCM8097_000403 [Rhodosporidiobolus ruineniae]
MHLLTLVTATLAVSTLATALAASPPALSLDFAPSIVYRSTAVYSCTPYTVQVQGSHPPFNLAALYLASDDGSSLSSSPLEVLGNPTAKGDFDPSASHTPSWDTHLDGMVVLVVTDATGAQTRSGKIEVKAATGEHDGRCRPTSPLQIRKRQAVVVDGGSSSSSSHRGGRISRRKGGIIAGCVLGALVVVGVLIFVLSRVCGRRRDEKVKRRLEEQRGMQLAAVGQAEGLPKAEMAHEELAYLPPNASRRW